MSGIVFKRAPRDMSRQAGFTLLELMLVTALIGILATMAIPKVMNWKARSIRAEAKTTLAGLRTSLESAMGETGAYSDDLRLISFSPDGSPVYIYGFTSDSSGSAINDTAELASVDSSYRTSNMVNAVSLPLTSADLPPSVVSASSYVIGAAGNVDGDGTLDLWTLPRGTAFVEVMNDIEN